MPIIPIRNLARGGIQKDVHPTSQALPGWSNGRNVCFYDGKVMRSPVWRRVWSNLNGSSSVRFCIARTPSSGFDEVIVGRDDGSLVRYYDGIQVEASQTGWAAQAATDAPWSGGFLGDVLYVNRQDMAPRALLPGAAAFTTMPSWDPTWRCTVLRTFQDSIIALNVTKGGTHVPSMVKVSDVAYYGQTPGSWDATDPTKLAYESPLSRLTGPILDGLTLGSRFLIYSGHQVLEMRNDGQFTYGFTKLFDDDGIINTNCVVALNGLHYVFGNRDIYVTDGATKKSLADGMVREWVYRTMNTKLSSRFFVWFNPVTNEVFFCHVSGDSGTAWKTPTGCNNAAVYNLTTANWSFVDLPNVSMVTLANANSVLFYQTCSDRTYQNVGGSYYDQENSHDLNAIAVSAPLNTRDSATVIDGGGTLLGYDFVDKGRLAFPADVNATAPSFVERTGIALDSPQEGLAPLQTTKLIRGIYPEVSVSRAVTLSVSFAGHQTATGHVQFGTPVQFNPDTDDVVDTETSGRYLAIRFDFPPFADTEVSGFDLDVVSNGRRS